MTLHYDGDHQNSASEAVSMFLQLCDNIGDNKLFDDEESAVNAVTEKAADVSTQIEQSAYSLRCT